ncbi:amino acid ABC transporter [Roseovarius spongiae]|uniref:Amino acid ABC transporter n=1 Tax=Roseovarius spongiae TaxID=2320272 RepID=A0A3A8B5I1_9RHOB|nr:transporter substrate-binding domain-containing protein [Roseovarius spongiae]RKF14816.1 amino acid ABC transporter [Roseovarius spongiae]
MTNGIYTIAITATLALGAAPLAQAQDTIRLGTEGAYPPFNFINDAGEVDGFERELGDELCKRAELSCVWVTNDWDSIIPNLVSGNYDTIMAGMSITDERDAVIDFTQNYIPPVTSAYVATDPDLDLSGAVVTAQANTTESAYVAETDSTLIEYATPDEMLSALRSGEADAVFADKKYLEPIVEDSGGELVWIGEDVQLGRGIGIGIRESDPELLATFDSAIGEMKEDGSLNELLTKWFKGEADLY